MVRVMFVVVAVLVSSPLYASLVEGVISNIIIETKESHFQRVGYVSLQIEGQKTGPNCAFLYLTPEDSIAISLTQNAFFHDMKVKILYKEDSQAPWGIGACAIKTIEISK